MSDQTPNTLTPPMLVNRHGEIPVGTSVWFEVENPSVNHWPSPGVLRHDGKVFYIETRAGRLDINTWLGAYLNTIQPVRSARFDALQYQGVKLMPVAGLERPHILPPDLNIALPELPREDTTLPYLLAPYLDQQQWDRILARSQSYWDEGMSAWRQRVDDYADRLRWAVVGYDRERGKVRCRYEWPEPEQSAAPESESRAPARA